ncbi:hypothetical protein ACQ4PT_032179 [Festuca glaucescens]
MTGLPRGQLEVKYYADYELEAVIVARLFLGGTSRPKVSDLAKMVEQYVGADESFKELWMLFIMSTVVAPTTDNKMSNKCYPMLVDIARANEFNLCKFVADELHDHLSNQKYTKGCLLYCMLRYFDALQTDHFELELGNARFAINAWSKLAIDAVGALDVQEYDTTTFGLLELKDEYKDVGALEMGLFGGPDGFDSWMKLNTHPSCTRKQRVKAFTLMQNFASGLNGLLSSLVQGLTKCSNGESSDNDADSYNEDVDTELSEHDAQENDTSRNVPAPRKVGGATGHAKKKMLVSPVVITRNGGQQDRITSQAKLSPAVETEKKLQEDNFSMGSPPAMHSQINVPSFSDLDGSDEVNGGGNETDSPFESTPQDDDIIRGSAAHLAASLSKCKRMKESGFPSSSETIVNSRIKNVVAVELGIPVRVSEQGNDPTAMIKFVPDHGQQVLETIPERDIVDDHLNPTSGNVELKGKDVIIEESTNSGILGDDHVPPVVSNQTPKKRKRQSKAATTPSRKSPRLASMYSDKSGKNGGNDVITESALPEDGQSASTAIVVSPTVTTEQPQKDGSHIVGDGNSLRTAIAISPTITMQQGTSYVPSSSGDKKCSSVEEGTTKENAIPISPNVTEAQASHLHANSCKSIVSSPVAQRQFTAGNSQYGTPWRVSPLVGANLGIPGLMNHGPVVVPPKVEDAVRKFSESVKKMGGLSRFAAQKSSSIEERPLKSKRVEIEKGGSSGAVRDNRIGMFTPPGFHLGFSSQESADGDIQVEEFDKDEDAAPNFVAPANPVAVEDAAPNVAAPNLAVPLAWAEPEPEGQLTGTQDGASSGDDFEQFQLSEEVQDVMAGKTVHLSENGMAELARYEELSKAFIARKRKLQIDAAPFPSKGETNVHSATPKVYPHKARVKKSSHYMQSPFDSSIKVTAEQEEIYQKIMLSSKHQRPVKSNIRMYQIIKYTDSFAYTSDLANSIHGRGELSNHCMEVGIEYLRHTNTVEGKLIVPYQISVYLMNGEFEKKAVVSLFKRTKDYSLSVMRLISFPVLQEMTRQQKEGNHWYSLHMNFQAERFEALDSMRGEGDEALTSHANTLISKIKALWKIHYSTSKVQIQNWDLKIINVPIQATIFDCGYHAIYNVEKWDGQNIPPLAKDDVSKLRRVMPHRWLTADFNKEKEN